MVAAWPQSGRTHQIRLHTAALGLPLVDDPLYRPGRARAGGAPRAVLTLTPQTDPTDSPLDAVARGLCVCCSQGEEAEFSEQQLRGMPLSLHAESITLGTLGLRYECPPPSWAAPVGGGAGVAQVEEETAKEGGSVGVPVVEEKATDEA